MRKTTLLLFGTALGLSSACGGAGGGDVSLA
jgi:hypothetical protein